MEQYFQKAAETIWNAWQTMGTPFLEQEVIQALLQLGAALIVVWIPIIWKMLKDEKARTKPKKKTSGGFKPPQWTSDGYYYDEKKQRWIEPDFKNPEPDTDTRLPK